MCSSSTSAVCDEDHSKNEAELVRLHYTEHVRDQATPQLRMASRAFVRNHRANEHHLLADVVIVVHFAELQHRLDIQRLDLLAVHELVKNTRSPVLNITVRIPKKLRNPTPLARLAAAVFGTALLVAMIAIIWRTFNSSPPHSVGASATATLLAPMEAGARAAQRCFRVDQARLQAVGQHLPRRRVRRRTRRPLRPALPSRRDHRRVVARQTPPRSRPAAPEAESITAPARVIGRPSDRDGNRSP